MRILRSLLLSLVFVSTVLQADTIKIGTSNSVAWRSVSLLSNVCKKYNLDIDVRYFDPRSTVTVLLASLDRGDFDLVGISTPSVLLATANGADIVIVANSASGGVSLIANPKITNLQALVGKRVGTMRGSGSEQPFLMSLDKAHISYTGNNPQVQLVNMSISIMGQAMKQGDVDAIVQPFPENLESLSGNTVLATYENQARPLIAKKSWSKITQSKFMLCYNEVMAPLANSKEKIKYLAGHGIVVTNANELSLSFNLTPIVKDTDLHELLDFLIRTNRISAEFKIPPSFNQSLLF